MGLFTAFTKLVGQGLAFFNGVLGVSVDNTTIQINGSGQLFATGSSTPGPLTTKGDIYGFDTAADRIPVGSNGQVLTADSTQALGVKWAAGGGGSNPLTTKGDLFGFDTAADRVPVGTNGQNLQANSALALGLGWSSTLIYTNGFPLTDASSFLRYPVTGAIGAVKLADANSLYYQGASNKKLTDSTTLYYPGSSATGPKLADLTAVYNRAGAALIAQGDDLQYTDGDTLMDSGGLYYDTLSNSLLADTAGTLYYGGTLPNSGSGVSMAGADSSSTMFLNYPLENVFAGPTAVVPRLASSTGLQYPLVDATNGFTAVNLAGTDGHLYSYSPDTNALAISAGAALGTLPSVSLTGTDQCIVVQFTTGTAPSANATAFTITFDRTWVNAINPARVSFVGGMMPLNAATPPMLNSVVNTLYVSSITTTQIVFTALGILPAGTFRFSFLVFG